MVQKNKVKWCFFFTLIRVGNSHLSGVVNVQYFVRNSTLLHLKGVFISHISVELPIFKMRNSTSNGCFCWHQFLTNGGKFHQKLVEITTIANGIKVGFSHPLGLTVSAVMTCQKRMTRRNCRYRFYYLISQALTAKD